MSLPSSIAHYRIVSKLGEGGMGAVYRATDTRLNRDVAIKVLPEAFASDAVRMARFEREAQVLAALNHPNIAAVYGIEQGAIVMELVPGEELKGPLPLETAIAYARQLAAALEAAHEKAIVHRDLKPANIKITPDGTLKVLDFGLAKAGDVAAASGNATLSPTISLAMTQAGMILGTAAYMSPEQARGKPVDKRADIWAFGVVLYEMLTGAMLFGGGETVSDAMAAVITKEPDWNALPKDTPAHVRKLLVRCLRKDPRSRLRDIGEARIALDEGEPAAETVTPAAPARTSRVPWIVASAGLLIGIVSLGLAWLRPQSETSGAIRFDVRLPNGTGEGSGIAGPQAVPSPDGRFIALVATADHKSAIWIRPINSQVAHRLDKTDGANFPFWSPDGQWVAFFADDKLKKIPAAGGVPLNLCEAPAQGGRHLALDGGSWSKDDVIVFAIGGRSPLMRVSAAGGTPTPVMAFDKTNPDVEQYWPQFLPDGHRFLFLRLTPERQSRGIYLGDLDGKPPVLVLATPYRAVWVPPGILLYVRENALFAQRLDSSFHPVGQPVLVADEITANDVNGGRRFPPRRMPSCSAKKPAAARRDLRGTAAMAPAPRPSENQATFIPSAFRPMVEASNLPALRSDTATFGSWISPRRSSRR